MTLLGNSHTHSLVFLRDLGSKIIVPGVLMFLQKAFSVTMPSGQTPSPFPEAVSPMMHDICITLLGSQPTVQRMKESKSNLLTTLNQEEKVSVSEYLDMYLQLKISQNIYNEPSK